MGVERPVTRWYLHHQSITNEIAVLVAKLAQMQLEGQEPIDEAEREAVKKQLADAQFRLRALGPCPRSMMG